MLLGHLLNALNDEVKVNPDLLKMPIVIGRPMDEWDDFCDFDMNNFKILEKSDYRLARFVNLDSPDYFIYIRGHKR